MRCPKCDMGNLAWAVRCVHCGFQLPTPAEVEGFPAPPPSRLSDAFVRDVEAELAKLEAGQPASVSHAWKLLLSLLAFVVLGRLAATWSAMGSIVLVVALHELGHYLGMRAF